MDMKPTYAMAAVRCPWEGCGEDIPVPIRVEIVDGDDGQRVTAEPEVDDVWAHYFGHS